jgi:hypothetical protein
LEARDVAAGICASHSAGASSLAEKALRTSTPLENSVSRSQSGRFFRAAMRPAATSEFGLKAIDQYANTPAASF